MAASLQHIRLCHAPVMLGQEASDGSVTQLGWHPLLQPPPHPFSFHHLSQTLFALSV